MELILDGEIYTEGIGENNIADKLKDYYDKTNQEGKLVKKVYLNGENKQELINDPSKIFEIAGEDGVKKVEVVTMTQEELVNETLDSVINYIDKLIDYNKELARSINEGSNPDYESLLQLTDSLEWVSQASNGLVITLKDANLKEKVDELHEGFGEVINALKKEDYPALGEILDGQIAEGLNDLKDYIEKVNKERKNTKQ